MINKGGDSGDATVRYWVENNESEYAFVRETVLTPPNVTVRLGRGIDIYSNQPTGDYVLRAEVEPLDSSIEPATAAQSFRVIEVNDTEEEPEIIEETEEETRTIPREGEEQPDPDTANVSIVDAPSVFNLVRGRPTFESVTVANTGDLQLENISLDVIGLPPAWVSTTPSSVDTLSREETETFALELDPPEDAPLQSYNGTLLAVASQASDRQAFEAEVFESLAEKIRADIERLEQQVTVLRERSDALDAAGVDVSGVRELIGEVETLLQDAREKLENDNPQGAVQDVEDADSLLQDAEQQLEKLEQPGTREAFALLPTVIAVLVILGVILGVTYLVKVRHASPFEAARERVHDVALEMKKRKMEEKRELQAEKKKTKRLINLLEAQHKEGVMDDESYEELKSSAEEKLRRINRELEED